MSARAAMFLPGLSAASMGWVGHQDLAAALRARGHGFEFLTWRDGAAAARDERSALTTLAVPAAVEPLRGLGAPFLRTRTFLPSVAALARHLRGPGRELDALYVLIAYPHGAAAALAARLAGWPGRLVLMPGGEDILAAPEAEFGSTRFAVPRRALRWALREAHGVACQSAAIRERVVASETRARLADLADNVMASVVALAREAAEARRERRRAARGEADRELATVGARLVLGLGRLHPVKGFDLLLDAAARDERAIVVLAGPTVVTKRLGDSAERLAARARELGLERRVRLLGRVPREKALALLAAADVLAAPSHCEGMPKVAVEAAAVGTPVVLSAGCGLAPAIAGTSLGRVLERREAEPLERALRDAAELRVDPDEARGFVERFSPEAIAEGLGRLLDG